MHEGVDIGGSTGNPVVASEAGTVVLAQWSGGYGRCVEISHGEGIVTKYAHLSTILVRTGQRVARGEVIGRIGSTGNATGPHLHFEVLSNGRAINPMNFL
jgi:murein DD-endopeptidase MepM/ murein hydrolase activator NlpD